MVWSFKKNCSFGLLTIMILFFASCSNSANNSFHSSKSVETLLDTKDEITAQSTQITNYTTKTEETSDNEVIRDIAYWNHPVKAILNQYSIKIIKVELLNKKVFPVFFVEFDPIYKLDSQGVEYFKVLLEKIASANSYWNFKVVDDKNKLVFEVDCDKDKKTVSDIIVNGNRGLLKEMVNYYSEMEGKWDKVTDYLTRNVPEIKQFGEQISKDSNGEVTLIMRLVGVPDKYSDSQYKDYYCIYVGENHLDYTVKWNSFYVNKDFCLILVEDIVTGDLIALNQWREELKVNERSSTLKIDKSGMKISEKEALKIINGLIEKKKIILTEPDSNCQVQFYESKSKNNMAYYVIRIAYIDPNCKENTETLARYWIPYTGEVVFQEDLWTGDLSIVQQ